MIETTIEDKQTVFKRLHWPGAGILLLLSAGFLIIGFIPLYVVNAFQRAGREKVTLPYVVMLLVGIAPGEYVAIGYLMNH